MYIQKRIVAAEEPVEDIEMVEVEEPVEGPVDEEVVVEPEASDLLFEVEDVAQLLAEVTGNPVDVTADDGIATFAIGEDEFTVEAEGDEEILESCKAAKKLPTKKTVAASAKKQRTATRTSKVVASKKTIAKK